MNSRFLTLRLLYQVLITAAAVVVVVAVFPLVGRETDPTGRQLLIGTMALAAATGIAVWFRHIVAVYVQIVALPILGALYLFELGRVDPVDQMLHTEQLWRLVKAKTAAGQPVTIQHSPAIFVEGRNTLALPDGSRVFPLAGVADLPTLMCREGARPFVEYVADEHGFNNPKGLWSKPTDLVFIGDSMTYGACLAARDHFIAQVRDRFPATLNLSNGGIGPLVYLAIAREFLPSLRPKYVFYMYDENNDLYFVNVPGQGDLIAEYRHEVLRRYLDDDGFSQRTFVRRAEIHGALKQLVDGKIAQGLSSRTFWQSTVKVLGLSLTRAGLRPPAPGPAGPLAPPRVERLPRTSPATSLAELDLDGQGLLAGVQLAGLQPDRHRPRRLAQQGQTAQPQAPAAPDHLEIFKTAFTKTLQVAQQAGARLVFVNIPAQATVCDGVNHPWKKPVLDFVARTGVDMIDLEKDFRNAVIKQGREQVFAVPPCGGHFSEAGYKVIGDRLLQYLELRGALSDSERMDTAAASLKDGWSYRGSEGDTRPPRVATRRTTLHEPMQLEAPLDLAGAATQATGTRIVADKYTPRGQKGRLRITGRLNAHAATASEVAAALVIDGATSRQMQATVPVAAGASALVAVTHERASSGAPIDVELRAGPARPGELWINSPSHAIPGGGATLIIEELSSSDQIAYVGTDLSVPELAQARRGEAERQRAVRPGMVSRALSGTKDWVTARFARTRIGQHIQEYQADAHVEAVIKTDGSMVTDLDGAGIMGYSWQPKAVGNVVRLKVSVPAWSATANSIVAAVYIDGKPEPYAVVSQELRPRQAAAAVANLELTKHDLQAVNIAVRVGVGRPGKVYLNSDTQPPIPGLAKPTLTIEEYAPSWR